MKKSIWQNEALLSKAAITSGSFSGGIGLSQEESDRFIDFVIDESRLKDQVRIERMTTESKKIDKIFLQDDEVLKPAVAVTDPGETANITTSQILLQAKEMIAVVRISDDALEDNIEGDEFADRIMGMVARASANQLEKALLLGRKLSPGTPVNVNQLWDGWFALAEAGNVVDAAGSGFSDRFISTEKLSSLTKALPTKFRADKSKLRITMSDGLEQDYSDILALRGTGLGDRAVLGQIPLTYRTIPLAPIALLPEDQPVVVAGGLDTTLDNNEAIGDTVLEVPSTAGLSNGDQVVIDRGTAVEEVRTVASFVGNTSITVDALKFAHSSGAAVEEATPDGTFALLSDYRNLIWGIQRDVRIETDRLPRLRATDWVLTMRMDANMENANATSLLKNLKVKA